MPIPSTIRVNPLDLQKNIIIGVALPFNAPGVFRSNYSTKDQVKSNLINLLLTDKGERIMNPEFGCDIRRSLFENITTGNISLIREKIISAVSIFIPEISETQVNVESDVDNHTITLTVSYRLAISGNADKITLEFV